MKTTGITMAAATAAYVWLGLGEAGVEAVTLFTQSDARSLQFSLQEDMNDAEKRKKGGPGGRWGASPSKNPCVMKRCARGYKLVGANPRGCGGRCVNANKDAGDSDDVGICAIPTCSKDEMIQGSGCNAKCVKIQPPDGPVSTLPIADPVMLETGSGKKKNNKGGKKKGDDGVSTMPIDNRGPVSIQPVDRVGKDCKTETGKSVCSACCKLARDKGLNHSKTLKCLFRQDKVNVRGGNKRGPCVTGGKSSSK